MKYLLVLFGCFVLVENYAQNVGIGTNIPKARLHVIDSNVIFSADGFPPATAGFLGFPGTARGMVWYADKGAFRAGMSMFNSWHKDSIGLYSFAGGVGNLTTGEAATSFGFAATSLGEENIANGYSSFAVGNLSKAKEYISIAMGNNVLANAPYSMAIGNSTQANSENSLAMGYLNDTVVATRAGGVDQPLLMVGNGKFNPDFTIHRSNAFAVFLSGNAVHQGYTKLGNLPGDNAPAIKMKEITGAVTSPVVGGSVTMPHGLDRSKIIAFSAIVNYGTGDVIPGFRATAGFEFSIAYDDTNIYIYNIAGNSANITSKPVKMVITYRE